MKIPKIRELPVNRLKDSAHNPEKRIAKANIASLVDSMSRNGLIYPILVTPQNVIIDGHRRRAAAKSLGWETIAAIIQDGEHDPDATYGTVNATSRKMGGNEGLHVWLKNKAATTPQNAKLFQAMADDIGIDLVRSICKLGMSVHVWELAKRIVRYCDQDKSIHGEIVDWLLEHGMASKVSKCMSTGQSATILLKTIKQNKPLNIGLVE